jgi:hypothetical protein
LTVSQIDQDYLVTTVEAGVKFTIAPILRGASAVSAQAGVSKMDVFTPQAGVGLWQVGRAVIVRVQ